MCFRLYSLLVILFFLSNCTSDILLKNKPKIVSNNNFTNKGFTLIYDEKLYDKKIISIKLDPSSLLILQKNLKKNTEVKITNLLNNKYLIAKVGSQSEYPSFNNSVISTRIASELNIDSEEPYIEIIRFSNNSMFIAKKAKMFEEEKKVAEKVPVNNVSISDLNTNKTKNKKRKNKNFSYTLKIADFYFENSALLMKNRITNETATKKVKIQKVDINKYRVFLGPFDNINSLQKSYNDVKILQFENIQIIKND